MRRLHGGSRHNGTNKNSNPHTKMNILNITSDTSAYLVSIGFSPKGHAFRIRHDASFSIYLGRNRADNLALYCDLFEGRTKAAQTDGFSEAELLTPAFTAALDKLVARVQAYTAEKLAIEQARETEKAQWLEARKAFAALLRERGLTVDWAASSDSFKATDALGTSATFEACREIVSDSRVIRVGYLRADGLQIAAERVALEDKADVVKKFLTCLPWFA
jgi:hypothetical protein